MSYEKFRKKIIEIRKDYNAVYSISHNIEKGTAMAIFNISDNVDEIKKKILSLPYINHYESEEIESSITIPMTVLVTSSPS